MAYKRNKQISVNQRTVRLSGKFIVGGSGAVSSQTGDGMTFANNDGVGVWKVTLADYYPTLISATGSVMCNVGVAKNQMVNFGTYTPSTGVLIIYAYADGTANDLSSGDAISVHLEMSCSTV